MKRLPNNFVDYNGLNYIVLYLVKTSTLLRYAGCQEKHNEFSFEIGFNDGSQEQWLTPTGFVQNKGLGKDFICEISDKGLSTVTEVSSGLDAYPVLSDNDDFPNTLSRRQDFQISLSLH